MKKFQNKTRIIQVSAALRTLTFILFLLTLMGSVAGLVNAVYTPLFLNEPLYLGLYLPLPDCVFALLSFYGLFRFFQRLQEGFLFDAQTVGSLNSAGTWWLMMWFYGIIRWVLMQSLYADKFDWSKFHTDSWGWLFAGLALKFVAWLLKEAQELQEEQELTV